MNIFNIEMIKVSNAINAAIVIVNIDGHIEFLNNNYKKHLNFELAINDNIKNIDFFNKKNELPSAIDDLSLKYKIGVYHNSEYFEIEKISLYNNDGLYEGILYIIRNITDEIELEHSLLLISKKDELADTYNVRYFFEQMEKEVSIAARYNKPLTLLFIDINNFKWLNDNFGHRIGDQIIHIAGTVFNNVTRKHIDTVCRYGGDEFTIILPETKTTDQLKQRLNTAFVDETTKILIEHREFKENKLSLAIGASIYRGQHINEMLKEADENMYINKKQIKLKYE
jgi:diguanylate cyclase (GGDEF)-like protein